MKNVMLKYGLIGGIIANLLAIGNWVFIARNVGVSASQMVGYLSIALSLLSIPFGVRYYRDNINSGSISFIKGMKIGLGITLFAGVLMALHSVAFFALQKEEFLTWQRENLSAKELAAFNEQLAQAPDFIYAPWFQGIIMFLMVFLIGAVVNLVSALLLKQEGDDSRGTAGLNP